MSEQAPDVIYLEVELSVEEYDLEVETGDSYDMELEPNLLCMKFPVTSTKVPTR